jgi:hypothetical protein
MCFVLTREVQLGEGFLAKHMRPFEVSCLQVQCFLGSDAVDGSKMERKLQIRLHPHECVASSVVNG